MKAKCPYCNDGCPKCKGGYTQVGFATGKLYTQHCNACGEDNGGRIAASFLPPAEKWEKPNPCVWCNSPDVIWLLIGEIGEPVFPPCHACAREVHDAEITTFICADCGEPVCLSHAADHKTCEDPKNGEVHRDLPEDAFGTAAGAC